MEVSIIDRTENPELTIAKAARQCYSVDTVKDMEINDEKRIKLIKMLLSKGHLSPFEHASFTFAIDGISRACSHQLVRHRIASFSQKSQRYCKEEAFEFVCPNFKDAEQEFYFRKAMDSMQYVYNELVKMGMRAEDARYVLPNACCTSIVVTMNVRELLHFFEVRISPHAQWEIRELAIQMRKQVARFCPVIFEDDNA